MLIDFHTHIFPDAIAERAVSQLVANAHAYASVYGEATPHTNGTADGLAASTCAAGLDVSVVMPIATSPRPSETINNFAAAVDKHPQLRSFGSVHPKSPDALRELERVSALGLRGIKLHPEYQGCFADDSDTIAVVRKATELGLWVLFHAGKDVGMPPPVHCVPNHVVRLRDAVPDARLILAHMGGFCQWAEAEQVLPALNVYVDTSFCVPNFPNEWDRFARMIRAFGTDHVLFGTDSPWASQKETRLVTQDFLKRHNFTADETAAILGGNAARILER